MLFSCKEVTWFPGTTRGEVAQRVVEQQDANANTPDRSNGWYTLAGGGVRFLIVNYDDITELTAFLQPYMDLMIDVRAINHLDYRDGIHQLRWSVSQSGTEEGLTRHGFA